MSRIQSQSISQFCLIFFVGTIFSLIPADGQSQETETSQTTSTITKDESISVGVQRLLEVQHDDGAWPYEGVYRVRGKIPVGYRIGGTAICCEALFYATDKDNQEATDAIKRGIELILKELEHPLMAPSTANRYDVRVWGHIYALDMFCRIKNSDRFDELRSQIEPWIPKLTEYVITEELDQGGWNYAGRRSHAGLVTAPALQALCWARQVGEEVPLKVFQRGADALIRSRNTKGAFAYSGDDRKMRPEKLPGSIARSANCELTLALLGRDRESEIQFALDAFHKHWDELEKRRKKTGTHKPPYGVAPYYFYYGHRYAALAIQGLPKEARADEYDKLFQVLLRTRDPDGTWNDRVFEQSKAYGTAMSVLAVLEDKVPLPAGLTKSQDSGGKRASENSADE